MEVLGAAATAALLSIFAGLGGILRVPEGHVAVYFRGGALLNRVDESGFRNVVPFITKAHFVQTTVQTDKVTDIPCGTAGGTVITFERIEVVNQLAKSAVLDTVRNYTIDYDKTWIYDKIHHEINQICSQSTLEEMYITKFDTLDETLRDALQRDIDQYAPGIRIIAIRVTKPKIPASIKEQYEKVEVAITKLKVAERSRKIIEQEAETERIRAVIEAEKLAAVEKVELERKIKKKETEQRVALIENAMHAAEAKSRADAELYRAEKEAEANKQRLTPELLQLEAIKALANNTKIFWGDKLPSLYADGNALLGSPFGNQ